MRISYKKSLTLILLTMYSTLIINIDIIDIFIIIFFIIIIIIIVFIIIIIIIIIILSSIINIHTFIICSLHHRWFTSNNIHWKPVCFCLSFEQSLQTNMYVVASESYDKTPSCDICSAGNRAHERCLDCEENMCTSCLSYHSKMKATRGHRTSQMGQYNQYSIRSTLSSLSISK